MRIVTNIASINSWRSLNRASSGLNSAMEKLSSGLRINSAKDDAAGLQISTKLSTQINGLTVAKRNANDGISMLQVAEGAQQEITNALQRMRELALQASNATYSKSDRKALNQEFLQLKNEIDHINEDTRFGDKRMFQTSSGSLIDTVERDMAKALQKTWLSESEDIIDKHFGLIGKGSLKIDFEHLDGDGGTAAYVKPGYLGGVAVQMVMVIDKDDFPDSASIHDDSSLGLNETILHEMVHATMAANFELTNLPTWFIEGSAEAIRGADNRLKTDSAGLGLNNLINDGAGGGNNSLNDLQGVTGFSPTTNAEIAAVYSGGYMAMRYMHSKIGDDGLQELMSQLTKGQTFDASISTATSGQWTNEAAFFTDMMTTGDDAANPAKTRLQLYVEAKMDLDNLDNGALGGLDASRGETRENTMQGVGSGRLDGTKGFREYLILNDSDNTIADFDVGATYNDPSGGEILLEDFDVGVKSAGGEFVTLQIGANSQQFIGFTLGSFNTKNLGLQNAELIEQPQFAIFAVDDALDIVNKQRAILGASMNRLDKTINILDNIVENASASRARIRDTDFAAQTAELTKMQITQQAATSLLAQANQVPQLALSLLQ